MNGRRHSRRRKEKEIRRKYMLDAALDLFSRKGYQHVSMHEIARHAEFAVGTLYSFFKNKEELYMTLIRETVREYRDRLTQLMDKKQKDEKDVLGIIRAYIAEKVRLYKADTAAYRLFYMEIHGEGFNPVSGLREEIRRYYDEIIQKLASIMKDGIRLRVFRRMDPRYMALSLDSMTCCFLFERPDEFRDETGGRIVSMIMDIFCSGVHREKKGNVDAMTIKEG